MTNTIIIKVCPICDAPQKSGFRPGAFQRILDLRNTSMAEWSTCSNCNLDTLATFVIPGFVYHEIKGGKANGS